MLLGAEYYRTDDAMPARGEDPRLGIGRDVSIGSSSTRTPASARRAARERERGDEADGDGYFIRNGIVIVPKNGAIKPGTTVQQGGPSSRGARPVTRSTDRAPV